jgi:hypothetical protein
MQLDDIPAASAGSAIGAEQLAQGLLLFRASTLKVVRLQLAIERRDRRVALEAVDDLVALDRCLRDYLSEVPTSCDHDDFRSWLEVNRSALNHEKLTIAAGTTNEGEAKETDTHPSLRQEVLDDNVWSPPAPARGHVRTTVEDECGYEMAGNHTSDVMTPRLEKHVPKTASGRRYWWLFCVLLLTAGLLSPALLGHVDASHLWEQLARVIR